MHLCLWFYPPKSRYHFDDEQIFVIYNSFHHEHGTKKIKMTKIYDVTGG